MVTKTDSHEYLHGDNGVVLLCCATLFGHREILHTLVGVPGAVLVAVIVLPG